jgi:hypothetical protein
MSTPVEKSADATPRASEDDVPMPPALASIMRLAPVVAPLLLVVSAGLLAVRFGLGPAILLLAAATLIASIWLFFRAMTAAMEPAEDGHAALVAESPAAARLRMAKRALKDLDYEKSVGNLNAEDYAALVAQYRLEAKDAMRAVDAERKSARAAAEALAKIAEGGDEAPAATASSDPTVCGKCGAKNDADARFCKACATPIGRTESPS